MTRLEQALYCANKGWHIIPIYGVKDGKCKCGSKLCRNMGKHPIPTLVPNGLKNSSNDPHVIESWFNGREDMNFAIRTGKESGIFVIDVDLRPEKNGNATLKALPAIPKTVESITGSGGRHILFAYPLDGSISNSTEKLGAGLDVRGDNGYILAPNSSHVSGKDYAWDIDHHPDDTPLSHAPEWLLTALQGDRAATAPESVHTATGVLLPMEVLELRSALHAINADNRDDWVKVGMALHSTNAGEQAYGLWSEWSMKSEKFNPADQAKTWRSFPANGKVNKETIFYMAQKAGWVNNPTSLTPAVEATESTHKQELLSHTIKAPDHTNAMPGALGTLASWMTDTAPFPQPILANAAAIAVCGTLYGQRYQTWTGLRSNVYTMGVAETGAGKEHARTMAKMFLNAVDPRMMGGGDLASGAGLLKSLHAYPVRLYMWDELGKMLEMMTAPNAPIHKTQIPKILLELYSTAPTTYYGTEYANGDGTKPRIDIVEPCVNIYGTSTPSTFYGALKTKNVADGLLPRILVFESSIDFQKRRDIKIDYVIPPSLIEHARIIQEIFEVNNPGNMASVTNGKKKLVTVEGTDEAKAMLSELEDFCIAKRRAGGLFAPLYSRVEAHVLKLSLIRAVSIDPISPLMRGSDVLWAIEWVTWSVDTMTKRGQANVADNKREENLNKIETMVKESKDGVTRTELVRRTRWLTPRERDEALEDLSEKIHKVPVARKAGAKGRNVDKYIHVG